MPRGEFSQKVSASTPRRPRAGPPQPVTFPPPAPPVHTKKFTTLHPKKQDQWMCQNKLMVKALRDFHYKTREKSQFVGLRMPPHTRSHAHTHAHTRNSHAHTHAHPRSDLETKNLDISLQNRGKMAFSVLLGVNSVWHGFLWICSVELFSFGISLQAFFGSLRRLFNEITRVRRCIRVQYVDFHYKTRENWQFRGRLFRFSLQNHGKMAISGSTMWG